MKKFLSLIGVMLISCCFLVGCGVSGNSTLVSIQFDKKIYYVDENCDTTLDYKIYPSTANNFSSINYSHSNQSFYQLKDGVFTARNMFSDVEITIQAADKTDKCYVVKKLYPDAPYLTHSSLSDLTHESGAVQTMALTTNSLTNLQMYGTFKQYFDIEERKFKDSKDLTPSLVSPEIFNFEMESSDPTVVQVVESGSLQIKTTGKTGTARINVYLLDDAGSRKYSGNKPISASIEINVVNPISQIKMLYSNKFVEERTGETIIYQAGSDDANSKQISVFVIDSNGRFVEDEAILSKVECLALDYVDNGSPVASKVSVSNKKVGKVGGINCVSFTLTIKQNCQTTALDKILIRCNYLLGNELKQCTQLLQLY